MQMIRVISLDETGVFEGRGEDIRFIGCVVADVEDYDAAKKELNGYLKRACQSFNDSECKPLGYHIRYPESVHGSHITYYKRVGDGNEYEEIKRIDDEMKAKAGKFVAYYRRKVIDYIKEHNYKVCIFLDPYTASDSKMSEEGMGTNITNIESGANLYERMAVLAIYNQVFYSLDDMPEKFHFDLATRTLKTNDELSVMYETFTTGGTTLSEVTNTSTYKTALATMLYEKGINKNIDFDFSVRSVNYKNKYETTPFTYMVDITCGYIRKVFRDKLSGNNISVLDSDVLLNIENELNGLFKIEIGVYTKVEALYRKLIENMQNNNIVDMYSLMYDIEKSKDKYSSYYIKKWLKKAEEIFKEGLCCEKHKQNIFKRESLEYAVITEGYMGIREEAYDKGLYIAKKLKEIVEGLGDYGTKYAMLFKLNDIIMRGYNHRGDICEVKKYIAACDKYKTFVTADEYAGHMLRVIVFYFNALDYDKALLAAKKLEELVVELKSVYSKIADVSGEIAKDILDVNNQVVNDRMLLLGKVYSSLGQAYAFLGKYNEAANSFNKALNEFSAHKSNYNITLCHYMHLLIQMNNQVEYELKAEKYFESDVLSKQWENAKQYGRFAVYLFVKAFKKFYAKNAAYDDVFDSMIEYVNCENDDSEHPWELIYKNVYDCAVLRNVEKSYQCIATNSQRCVKNAEYTVLLIMINAKLNFMGMVDENTVIDKGLSAEEIKACRMFLDKKDGDALYFKELKAAFDKKMTYEYE